MKSGFLAPVTFFSMDESERNKRLLELDAESAELEQIQFAGIFFSV